MKFLITFILITFLYNCSFDNKTGIWKNENSVEENENEIFDGFKTLSTASDSFDKVITIVPDLKFSLYKPVTINKWTDIFFSPPNNSDNFSYNQQNTQIFKSKKLTKHKINNHILSIDDNIITSDEKGNLIIFSIQNNKILNKYNFYKKRFKKFKKYLNLYVENNIVYVSDNIGYLYAYDFYKNKIIWAKNYKIPFRGNLKIFENKLIATNQNNSLFFFDKSDGNILRTIPTEETIVKNKFKNNLAINDKTLFLVNTFGSIYSVNLVNLRINWFVNLNETTNLNNSNLFYGSPILLFKNKIIISSNKFTYLIDSKTGSIIYKINFSSQVRPIVLNDYLFLITKKDLLVTMNISNSNLIFSSDINQNISDFLNQKKYKIEVKSLNIVNNKIFIFLKNSYYLKYNLDGTLEEIKKFPSKINSQPIFIKNSIFFIDRKNKLSIID